MKLFRDRKSVSKATVRGPRAAACAIGDGRASRVETRAMSRPHAPVRRTLTRLTILRTRSSRSSTVIICDASRLTPCATAWPCGWWSSRVAPAAPDGPAAPLAKGSGVKNRGDETSFTVGAMCCGRAERTRASPNRPRIEKRLDRSRRAPRVPARQTPKTVCVGRSEKRSAALTPRDARPLRTPSSLLTRPPRLRDRRPTRALLPPRARA